MKISRKLGTLTAALALGFIPAIALAAAPGNSGTHRPATPGANASLGAKAKAYGKFCQGESKTHVAGTPGTPFSTCVTDMAHAAHHQATSPKSDCKNESKKHVNGQKGTPFSICVTGAAKLLKSLHSHSTTTTTTTTTTSTTST